MQRKRLQQPKFDSMKQLLIIAIGIALAFGSMSGKELSGPPGPKQTQSFHLNTTPRLDFADCAPLRQKNHTGNRHNRRQHKLPTHRGAVRAGAVLVIAPTILGFTETDACLSGAASDDTFFYCFPKTEQELRPLLEPPNLFL